MRCERVLYGESIQYFDFNSILELYPGLDVRKGRVSHFHIEVSKSLHNEEIKISKLLKKTENSNRAFTQKNN